MGEIGRYDMATGMGLYQRGRWLFLLFVGMLLCAPASSIQLAIVAERS